MSGQFNPNDMSVQLILLTEANRCAVFVYWKVSWYPNFLNFHLTVVAYLLEFKRPNGKVRVSRFFFFSKSLF